MGLSVQRTIRMAKIAGIGWIALAICNVLSAQASNLTFQGQNAGLFPGANPSDTSVLMNSVAKPAVSPGSYSINPSTLIEQSILSQISSKIYNQIFQGTAASGYYDLGNGSTVSYARSGGYITINITSPTNGTTTISVPDQ